MNEHTEADRDFGVTGSDMFTAAGDNSPPVSDHEGHPSDVGEAVFVVDVSGIDDLISRSIGSQAVQPRRRGKRSFRNQP